MVAKYDLAVLGTGGVGKSCLTIQFCLNKFVEDYNPTVEDTYSRTCRVDDIPCQVSIMDTAGQEEFISIRDQWIRDCDSCLIIYDVTSRESFKQACSYFEDVQKAKEDSQTEFPVILVGNKIDLLDRRVVSKQEAKEMADSMSAIFVEASAKTGEHVEECFFEAIRHLRLTKKEVVNPQSKLMKRLNAICSIL